MSKKAWIILAVLVADIVLFFFHAMFLMSDEDRYMGPGEELWSWANASNYTKISEILLIVLNFCIMLYVIIVLIRVIRAFILH